MKDAIATAAAEAEALLTALPAREGPPPRRRKRRDWSAHDAKVPYHDERLARMNGTNRAGRRPHAFIEPQLRPLTALVAANDNRPAE